MSTMIDWETCIKPLLSGPIASPTANFTEENLQAIVCAINANSKKILDHESIHECFYSCFVALSGHYIATSFDKVPKYYYHETVRACKTLLKFCLGRLLNFDVQCAVPQKNLMQLISALCVGNNLFLRGDLITFTAMLKSATLPMIVQKQTSEVPAASATEKSDHVTAGLLAHMAKTIKLYSDGIYVANSEECIQRSIILKENVAALSHLTSKQKLDRIYQNLPYLRRYINRVNDQKQGKPLVLPTSHTAAIAVRNGVGALASNINIILQVISLPMNEPVMPETMENFSKLGLSSLYAGLSVAAAMTVLANEEVKTTASGSTLGKFSKEPDYESIASNIIADVIEVYHGIQTTFSSHHIPVHVLQNYRMAAACILSQGLLQIISQDDEKKASESKMIKIKKFVINPMLQALSSIFTEALEYLLIDCETSELTAVEVVKTDLETAISAPVDIFNVQTENNAFTRFNQISKHCDFLQMLVDITFSCFERFDQIEPRSDAKIASTKTKSDSAVEDDSGASEDEVTFDMEDSDNNDISSSDEETGNGFGFSGGPILGEWFLSILEEPEEISSSLEKSPGSLCDSPDLSMRIFNLPENSVVRKDTTALSPLQNSSLLEFTNKILSLISQRLISSKCQFINEYLKKKLTEDVVFKLAYILNIGDHLDEDMFVLMDLLHNLLSSDLITDDLQQAILKATNMASGMKQVAANSRGLSLLFTILFQNQIKAQKENDDDPGVTDFMKSVVAYLTDVIATENDIEKDLSFEVLEMCVFLFHSLSAPAKNGFFKSVIEALENCNEENCVPFATARLLMLLDYVLHHYTAPAEELFSHVQTNLLSFHLENPNQEPLNKDEFGNVVRIAKVYTPFKLFGQSFEINRKVDSSDCIHNVIDTSNEEGRKQGKLQEIQYLFFEISDVDKTDRKIPVIDPKIAEVLADLSMEKSRLYRAVVKSLDAGSKLDLTLSTNNQSEDKFRLPNYLHKVTFAKFFVKYCFQIGWRIHEAVITTDLLPKTEESTTGQVLSSTYLYGLLKQSDDSDKMLSRLLSLLANFLENQFLKYEMTETEVLTRSDLPPFYMIMTLHCLLTELHSVFWGKLLKEVTQPAEDVGLESAAHAFKLMLRTLKYFSKVCRSFILLSSNEPETSYPAYNSLMQMDVSGWKSVNDERFFTTAPSLPDSILQKIQKWNSDISNYVTDLNQKSEAVTGSNILQHYGEALTSMDAYYASLMLLSVSLFRMEPELSAWISATSNEFASFAAQCIVPLQTDSLMKKICQEYSVDLAPFEVAADSEKYHDTLCLHILNQIYKFIVTVNMEKEMKEQVFSIFYLTFLEKLLGSKESASIKRALYQFFASDSGEQKGLKEFPKSSPKPLYKGIDLECTGKFVSLLLSCDTNSTEQYIYTLFSLVCKMFEKTIGKDADPNLVAVISKLNEMLELPSDDMTDWLKTFTCSIFVNYNLQDSAKSGIPMKLVQYLSHPEAPVDHNLALNILKSSLTVPDRYFKMSTMTDFLSILMVLAEAKNGLGHFELFKSSLTWLTICQQELADGLDVKNLGKKNLNIVNVCELLLFYVMDVLTVLHGEKNEDDFEQELDSYFQENIIQDSEDFQASSQEGIRNPLAYDQEEEEALCNKLCTFTVTQKEFMDQHWYYCHTCEMTEGIGVCTICAKVCHKGHDLAYAKYGSFFCDCGAKGSKACHALVKRDPLIENSMNAAPSNSSSNTTVIPSSSSSAVSVKQKFNSNVSDSSFSLRHAGNSGFVDRECSTSRRARLCKCLDGCRDQLMDYLDTAEGRDKSVGLLVSMISDLQEIVSGQDYRSNSFCSIAHAIQVMKNLHVLDKKTEIVNALMVPTLGSQEGAFENVKANFTGEQGQTIRQLINTRMISRVAMCCLSSGSGRRHHLAVSHEKTKLTILQLSALLKQADASKRKLTLTRLSTTQIPFTVVTLCSNPCNEEILAVCGLKDCHVLTFSQFGIVNDHVILHPQLTAGNYIVKAVWLPGSQCEIAIVTAKFIKIYNLSKDALSPAYYFLLPTGKIRDASFIVSSNCERTITTLVVMSSSGYMYTQPLNESSSATHGPFYVTNALSINDESLQEKNDQVGGGGVSVYYSHTLRLLFFSYANGKNFAATLDREIEQATKLFPITYKLTNGKSNSNGNQTLYGWSEVNGHPGILTCFTNSAVTPVAVMVDPTHIYLQEIKPTTSKAKIQDIVAVRHSSVGEMERTTMIALCEDGSLRIYLANQEYTGFWLSPSLQPKSVFTRFYASKNKGALQKGGSEGSSHKMQEPVEPVFPVDFFEHCQLINSGDLEYGGDSLLKVYNPNQIKNRLNNQGMYIVSKKNFPIEITNKNKNMVITGLRMQLGNKGGNYAPTHIYIGSRYVTLGAWLKKPRWFDFPLTREESIQFHNKLVIVCGASVHPDDYNIVDSIKVYGKTKEAFGWQEEDAKAAASAGSVLPKVPTEEGKTDGKKEASDHLTSNVSFSFDSADFSSPVDKLLLAAASSLNSCLAISVEKNILTEEIKSTCLRIASSLITHIIPRTILTQVKKLLMKIFSNQEDYHMFKDKVILMHAFNCLAAAKEQSDNHAKPEELDLPTLCPDEYQVLLMELNRIAVRRPDNLTMIENELPATSENTEDKVEEKSLTTFESPLSQFYSLKLQEQRDMLFKFIEEKPSHRFLAPSCLPGISHVELSVQAFVDIVHSVAMTISPVTGTAADIYFKLLTSNCSQISSAARSTLIRLLYHPILDGSRHKHKPKNSKSIDTAPSTRSNSPPSTISSQTATTAPSEGISVHASNQSGFQHSASYISSHGTAGGTINDDFDNEEDSDGDEFEDDEDAQMEEEIIMEEERESGIAPSLNRDEQLMAMQALEENMQQQQISAIEQSEENENGNNAESAPQDGSSQVQNDMQRLQDLMQAADGQNYFMQEDSLEDMDAEYGGFEADDEAMVEFAIALSLQQSGGEGQDGQGTVADSNAIGGAVLNEIVQSIGVDEVGELHSAQQQRVPVEDNPISNVSATKVVEPEVDKETVETHWKSIAGTSGMPGPNTTDAVPVACIFDGEKMEQMRMDLLEEFIKRIPEVLRLESGEQSIPYFQVLIMLIKCIDPNKEEQQKLLEKLVQEFAFIITKNKQEGYTNLSHRSPAKEIMANVIRCLVILMSGRESSDTNKDHQKSVAPGSNAEHSVKHSTISGIVASVMVEYNVVEECFTLLYEMLNQHWNIGLEKNKSQSMSIAKLIKPVSQNPVPDYSPIIVPQYVKAHTGDVFEAYPELLTEWLLHLPYRFKKFYDSENMPLPEKLIPHYVSTPPAEETFCWILSDYMLSTDIPVIKKRVRKALLYLCGSKENYREIRDVHALTRYLLNISETWSDADVSSKLGAVNLPYDKLISLVTYLDACTSIAAVRPVNWQKFCLRFVSYNNRMEEIDCMYFFLELSIHVGENIATRLLKLLTCAVSMPKKVKDEKSTLSASSKSTDNASVKIAKSEPVSKGESKVTSGNEQLATKLSQRFLAEVEEEDLHMFLQRFLLEINTTSVRWSAHEFVLLLFQNSTPALRTKLVNAMWMLWPSVPNYGRKSVQFVDLLGYLSIENGLDSDKSDLFTDAALAMLKKQNVLLTNHPNSMMYMQLSNYVEFDGYFLESNPCLVCNQPEVPFSNLKLTSVKADTKYTTTQQIIKLVGSYSLQKVSIKITDIKQTKMIRTVSLLYNNKKVPAIIELKNKPELWHKAKQVVLTQGQTEVKFDLPLPVVATNLMLEFSEFYENVSATTETLQCPRCSASVQANPGICGNCGENVFQCHKCRSINYDEKDPFLCNVCGFSKYAKFDVTLLAKPCCAVDTIENEEDRKKMVGVVSVLLEKADLAYYQMLSYKPHLEHLLLQIEKLTTDKSPSNAQDASHVTAAQTGNNAASRLPILNSNNQPITLAGGAGITATAMPPSSVNVHIRQLAQKYCFEAKNSFEELSKIMKTVLASRKEIVQYDQRQKMAATGNKPTKVAALPQAISAASSSQSANNCYGCAAATSKQCIILLRALATDKTARKRLVNNGLITELVNVSLRRGNVSARKHVQQLICQLVRNDHEASAELNSILLTRITSAVVHHNHDLFPASVSAEMNLLVSILGIQDRCWQLRLRTVVQLFQLSLKMQSPAVIENITLPCLKMLESKTAPSVPPVTSNLIKAARHSPEVSVDAEAWMMSDPSQHFNQWKIDKIRSQICKQDLSKMTKAEIHDIYLQEKYVRKWTQYVIRKRSNKKESVKKPTQLPLRKWLKGMLFCKSSKAVRQAACMIVKSIAENKGRKAQVIDLLTSFLDELSNAGEAAAEFFVLYQEQIYDAQWKVYLAAKDILPFIGSLIEKEIANLLQLEESTLMLDLQQGYSLKELTELLSELVHVPYIRQHYKSSLVGTVLNSYLSLRKLVIQRTNIIDDTQELLLELLEDMTTGTESETRAFMAVCIETINKYELSDIRTPQFIFERLANIIFPEENNTNEFFLSLEKDPLQEDFLQGRMVGNPYSSNEPGLSPLMRDVKNKICRDCDLVALLEDDNGMELLVNNKIISLDLPVRDVYTKVWLPSHGEDEAMRVVYRMRGLLGEATEDIVEKLDAEVDNRDEEEVYKMASVLSKCGGIEAMLQRLESVESLSHGRQLVDSIMKLLMYAVRLRSNRNYLAQPELNTLNVLLGTLNLGLQSGESGVPLVEQLLQVMDRVLQESADNKTQFFKGDKEKLTLLLQQIDSELVRHHSKVLRGMMKIIPFLCFGDTDLMQMLIDHFKSTLEFEKFDDNHTAEDTVYLDCFCEICTGIENNQNGNQLKDLIIKNEIVNNALSYIGQYVPQHKKFESEDWKQFVSRSALPYSLRLLAGLSTKHPPTQMLIGATSIPDLHRLEQISTQESIGSLAENVLEAISENPDVARAVKDVRLETRAEKKRVAMAVRQKELGALGMKTNAKGQVVTQTPLLKQIGELVDESGLTCIICREGYKFEPKKVLGIYTFSRRCTLEEFENKPRKQQGYSTVSHFNVVHYDCHTSAVRAARGREEWESAMLQNANTKCNGLLPLWGPQVPESAFATSLARHNTYLQEATGFKEPNVTSTVHDLKLLMLRFAYERSFSEETGGGGQQSNIHLIPYLVHMALYVINTTRCYSREERVVSDFLEERKEKWPQSSYNVDGPLYISALSLFVSDATKWKSSRMIFLKRLLVLSQCRNSSASAIATLKDRDVKQFQTYRPYLLLWSMMELIYTELFSKVPKVQSGDNWSSTLADYIRHNDAALLETSEKMMTRFLQECIPIASFDEFVDFAGIYEEVGSDMPAFLKDLFESLPA